ncbi:MAG: phosphatidate cytidylyltransferase [Fimbriimonadaceae bacterium]|nr:phosphatidate cytidylyltransferase [Fimbriimonadaceae bacterium]
MMDRPAPDPEGGLKSLYHPSSLRARIFTGVTLGMVSLGIVSATSSWVILGLLIVATWFCASEAADLVCQPRWIWLLLTFGCVFASLLAGTATAAYLSGALSVVGVLALSLRFFNQKVNWLDFLGVGWVAGPMVAGMWLHSLTAGTPTGWFAMNGLVLCLVPIWIGDTMAYVIGKSFGKTKMAPQISPKKTWEGAGGYLLGSVGSALVLGLITNWPLMACLAVGLSAGVFGQLGDLFQSSLKRAAGLKDSGALLPGHGGALDRLDSYLLSVLPSALVLLATYPSLFHVKQ